MAAVRDLYEILGVSRDASQKEIRAAYRALARELHPDVNADPADQERFKEITGAYEILSDPAKRRRYDDFGATGGPGAPFKAGDATVGTIGVVGPTRMDYLSAMASVRAVAKRLSEIATEHD